MVITWDSARHVKTNDFHDEKKGLIHDGDADANRCRGMIGRCCLWWIASKQKTRQKEHRPAALEGPSNILSPPAVASQSGENWLYLRKRDREPCVYDGAICGGCKRVEAVVLGAAVP